MKNYHLQELEGNAGWHMPDRIYLLDIIKVATASAAVAVLFYAVGVLAGIFYR